MGHPQFLNCARCGREYPSGKLLNLCSCGGPLLVRYDISGLRERWKKSDLRGEPANMWRYAPVLPAEAADAVTLGEGWTPLVEARRLGNRIGAADLWIKDEGRNPTDSFKARGLSCAVTTARLLGAADLAIPSAGNAASALAAYSARAGLRAHIYMPSDVPNANFVECRASGAEVSLANGLISDCARLVAERAPKENWFDVSTLKEPYRIEGKKTMGYEIAEQFDWKLPDAILYPCGGGVGLIGIWKAFSELEELGWIAGKRPKMIAVQAAGCAPIVKAWEAQAEESVFWADAHTAASGLRVPKALGDFLVLRALRESGGTALAVTDEAMLDAAIGLAESEGIFPAPEGGACVAALENLLATGELRRDERIVILNTGSGLKYLEAYGTRFPRRGASEQDKLGGLITPR